MKHKGIVFFFVAAGVLLLFASVFLFSAIPVAAQCGSQASSCKNCHETQAQGPVNNDGTAWHTEHAFGDFCYLCHGGNNQATDETAAHTGMVAPLSNVAISCQSCHPDDTLEKAQIYASTLGQPVGTGGNAADTGQPAATDVPAAAQLTPEVGPTVVVPAADMVDYSQRYDEIVLGKKPVNVGDVILIVLLAVILLGGGFFVLRREGWINVTFDNPKLAAIQEKYPADIVEMLPDLGRLKPASRRILQNILTKPHVANDLFASIDRLTQKAPTSDTPTDGGDQDA